MITEEYIKGLVNKIINEQGFFTVSIRIKPVNRIFVEVDSFEGIRIDECAEISREIERNLNRDQEDFELNVSSPGLNNAFKVKEQYVKNLGKELNIQTTNGENLTGILKEINSDNIIIDQGTNKRGNNFQSNNFKIEFSKIKSAKIVLKY